MNDRHLLRICFFPLMFCLSSSLHAAEIKSSHFGSLEGAEVSLFTLKNANGVTAKITNYGATITSLVVPDRHGKRADIVCGFDTFDGYFSEAYVKNSPYFGCTVGRYASVLDSGKFSLNEQTFQLSRNMGDHHLHGGIKGFDKLVWDAEVVGDKLKMQLTSPDGDMGYPGEVKVSVSYQLTDDNKLIIQYDATTDKATPLSLTDHTYWNLGGFKEKILNHEAQILSDAFLASGETGTATGEKTRVAGTVWDFNQPKKIATVFEERETGFEHFYVFDNPKSALRKVAVISESASGRKLEVSTTEPGMLFYTGVYTSDELARENGDQYGQFRGFCCEASRYPNGPNIENSPGSITVPGKPYRSTLVYQLSW